MQLQLSSANLDFSAQAEPGADHTVNKLHRSPEWRGQSDILDIHPVHAN